MKGETFDPILIVKRTEWSKFIDYFSLSIEDNPYKVGKLNVHFVLIGYIPITSSGNTRIPRHHLYKQFNLEPPKLRLYQLTKNIPAKIASHIYSALRDLGVIFNKSILYRSPILAGADRAGTEDSCYGTENEQ